MAPRVNSKALPLQTLRNNGSPVAVKFRYNVGVKKCMDVGLTGALKAIRLGRW